MMCDLVSGSVLRLPSLAYDLFLAVHFMVLVGSLILLVVWVVGIEVAY
jgi:hypothetical protein